MRVGSPGRSRAHGPILWHAGSAATRTANPSHASRCLAALVAFIAVENLEFRGAAGSGSVTSSTPPVHFHNIGDSRRVDWSIRIRYDQAGLGRGDAGDRGQAAAHPQLPGGPPHATPRPARPGGRPGRGSGAI